MNATKSVLLFLKEKFAEFRRAMDAVDTAFMASTLAMAGEVETAQDMMRRRSATTSVVGAEARYDKAA